MPNPHLNVLLLGVLRGGLGFYPSGVWWRSANLTEESSNHLEMATWSEDCALCEDVQAHLADINRISGGGPEPH